MCVEKIVVGILPCGKNLSVFVFRQNLLTLPLADLAATYSPASYDEVPLALGRFTAVFGMGTGAATPP